jgi:chromosome segregation ATPase
MGTSILRAVLFIAAAATTAIAVEPASSSLDAWVLLGSRDANQMSGSMHDLARARRLAGDGPALFARQNGHEWLIRDAKLLARAKLLLAPIEELGRKQGALGEKQGALGAQEGELGRKMGALSADSERNQRLIEALGHQMEALGDKMSALGEQQEAMGAKMEQAEHEMQVKLAALVDEARAANLAQPVK